MESDKDIRELEKIIEEIIKAKAFDDSMKTLLPLANNYTRIAFVVQKIAEVLAIHFNIIRMMNCLEETARCLKIRNLLLIYLEPIKVKIILSKYKQPLYPYLHLIS
jgi:hypothetical protein